MKRNRSTIITFPVFPHHKLTVIHAKSVKETGKRLGADLSECKAAFVWDMEDSYKSWMVLGVDADENTIAHESCHAIRHMLKESGVRIDNEVFAYHLGYLVEKVHKFLDRGKRVRARKAA